MEEKIAILAPEHIHAYVMKTVGTDIAFVPSAWDENLTKIINSPSYASLMLNGLPNGFYNPIKKRGTNFTPPKKKRKKKHKS